MDIFLLLWIFVIGILFGFLIGSVIIYRKVAIPLKKQKKSMASLYGKITEQFAPFMKDYPYDTKKFRFIGSPIDGIQFEDDKIIFVEFKSAGGKLSQEQKKIKKLVEDKKVEWFSFEIKWE
ncbi:MAG TPA: endonuclease [Thermoplasmatales archaeon]|nr:endonuclease [Thermoplasmatales archaeon]